MDSKKRKVEDKCGEVQEGVDKKLKIEGTSTDAQLIWPVSAEQGTSVSGQENLPAVAGAQEKSPVVVEASTSVDVQEKMAVVIESDTSTGAQEKLPVTVVPSIIEFVDEAAASEFDTAAEKKLADEQPIILIVVKSDTPADAQEKSPVATEQDTSDGAEEKMPVAVEPGTSIAAQEKSPVAAIIEPVNAVAEPDSAISTESEKSKINLTAEPKKSIVAEEKDSVLPEPTTAAVLEASAIKEKCDSDSSPATDEWITIGGPAPSDIVDDQWSSVIETEKMTNAPDDNTKQTVAKHEDKPIAQTQNIADVPSNNEPAANVEEVFTISDDDSGSPARQHVVGKNDIKPTGSALIEPPLLEIIDLTHSSFEDESPTKKEPAQTLSDVDLESTDDEDGTNIDEGVQDAKDEEFKVPLPSSSNADDAAGPGGGPQLSGMPPHHAHQSLMMNGPRMNGPPMNGPPMGNPMVPHMIPSPNGPMHGPIPGPIPSPINNMGPSPMSGPMQGNGPINGPMMSPMGPMNNGGPLGPMNSPLNGPMNGPGPMNGMSSPMNGPINGMGGNMNSPMGGPPPCPMNHPGNQGPMNNNFMMPMNNMYQKPLPVSAGKVYPADQPMVFNSQNPNAPPIYPCGVCHKEVHDNDQAILCESGCNFWFHRGCTGLTETAYQMLTAEVYAEWVCDKCLSSKNIPLVKFKP